MPTSPSGAGGDPCGRLSYAWRPRQARGTVLLVHGLGADSTQTWGAGRDDGFLARLIRSGPGFAVACYDYPARLGLPGQDGQERLPTLPQLSRRLAAAIRGELVPAGGRVAVVGYCLGGLITRFALPRVLAADREKTSRDGGPLMLLLDAPEDWPDSPLGPALAAIAGRLALDQRTLRANAAWWADRAGPAGQVEDYAVVSNEHCWITPFKPGSTVPASRVLRTGIGHLDLTKPPAASRHQAYDYVAARLERYFGGTEGTNGRSR